MSIQLFELFGFQIDWTTWNWGWTLSTKTSVYFHIVVCLVYAITVKILQLWVASKSAYVAPSWLESFRKVHNVSLAVVSFLMFLVMTYCIYIDGRLKSWHTMACQMTPMSGLYGFINFIYLISKIWEWVDTYILVLSKKPVISLHWFHHMTTFTMAALTHNFPVGGFALINCLVHTVMYMHYFRPVRWARPFITSGQLIQFIIVISIHLYGLLNPATCFNMTPVIYEYLFCLVVVVGFFLMFALFFAQEYIAKKPKSAGGSAGRNKIKDI